MQETYSRFGGLWIDRKDALQTLSRKIATGEVSEATGRQIGQFMRDGCAIFKGAVPKETTRRIREELQQFWETPPEDSLVETFDIDGTLQVVRPELRFRAGVTKLLDYYAWSPTARKAIASSPVVEFLSAIFEAKPKAFQGLTFWKGSQQASHKDTAFVEVKDAPMHLAATWLALEDIQPGTGELEYFLGSHRAPDYLFGGEHKWLSAAPQEYATFLASIQQDAQTFGHRKASFVANEGDVLVWHADLAHGGGPITKANSTRQSLVTHYTAERNDPPYQQHAQRAPVEQDGMLFISAHRQIA